MARPPTQWRRCKERETGHYVRPTPTTPLLDKRYVHKTIVDTNRVTHIVVMTPTTIVQFFLLYKSGHLRSSNKRNHR